MAFFLCPSAKDMALLLRFHMHFVSFLFSNAFLGFPTAWEQPSRTKGGFLSPYQDWGPLLKLAIVP
jgi:hypothetical protein